MAFVAAAPTTGGIDLLVRKTRAAARLGLAAQDR
jgi:hypothetical protein